MKKKTQNGRAQNATREKGTPFPVGWYFLSPVQRRILGRLMLGAVLSAFASQAMAEEPEAEEKEEKAEEKEPLTPEQMFEGGSETYGNWVELSYGGMLTSGSKGAAQERMHLGDGIFGGIEDLHFQKQINKDTLFTLDGRALFNAEDYKLSLSLVREKLGFVKFRFQQFRTWYNNSGGYYAPADLWLPAYDETLFIDRGEIGFIAGLTLKGAPEITFEYIHQYRSGTKDSTSWGPVNLGFHSPDFSGTRGVAPAFWDIDEQRDIFKLDLKHQIKSTEFGAGVRYETGDIDNARKVTLRPGEPNERRLTHREGSSDSSFSAHAWSETWLKPNLMFSLGGLYSRFNSDLRGSRIYGDDFDVNYSPSAANGAGFVDLDGTLQKREYVANLNLMAIPFKDLTITPSLRIQSDVWDAESVAAPTSGNSAPGAAVISTSDGSALDLQERLDVHYSGVTNWVFWARGEWTQGEGDLRENGGLGGGILRDTDTERRFQKYSVGARWYPSRLMTFDVGGYYKKNSYDYDNRLDNTLNGSANRYPAYLVMQDFETYDGNLRVTIRPFKKVMAVSRYEYQLSTIATRPDSAAGLAEVESSEMTTHIFAQNISYVPWSRLSLQAGFNWVHSETETPASNFTRAALAAQNSYWTVNFNSTFVLDNRTDLSLGYFYYESDNARPRLVDGLSLGSDASEHGVTALLTRRLTDHLRLKMRYTYFHSEDYAYGRNNDFDAHVLFTSLQYRF